MDKAGRSCLTTHNEDFCTEVCRKPVKSQSATQRAWNDVRTGKGQAWRSDSQK